MDPLNDFCSRDEDIEVFPTSSALNDPECCTTKSNKGGICFRRLLFVTAEDWPVATGDYADAYFAVVGSVSAASQLRIERGLKKTRSGWSSGLFIE